VLGWPGGPEEAALRKAAEAYNAKATDADKVKLIFFNRDGFFDKLAADLAAGSKDFDVNLLATYAIGRYAPFMDPITLPPSAKDVFGAPFIWTFRPFAYAAMEDAQMIGVLALSCVAGVARIEDDSPYTGTNVYGGYGGKGGDCSPTTVDPVSGQYVSNTIDGKSHGAPLSLGGTLYAWITPGSGVTGYQAFSLWKSTDKACTWTQVGVTFDRATYGISFGGFVQFGKDNGAAIDGYVYTIATAVSDASRLDIVQRPGRVMLLRVPAASIEVPLAYQFFAGLDSNGQPTWLGASDVSKDPSKAVAVYENKDGVGPFPQMSYVPALGRFVFTANFLGNSISGFRLNPDTGTLAPTQATPYPSLSKPTAVACIPHGNHSLQQTTP